MMTYTIKHKHCGMTKTVEGNDLYDAIKKNNIDTKVWDFVVDTNR